MGGRSGHHNSQLKIDINHSSTVSFLSDMFLDIEKKLEFQFTNAPFYPWQCFLLLVLALFCNMNSPSESEDNWTWAQTDGKKIPLRINKLPLLMRCVEIISNVNNMLCKMQLLMGWNQCGLWMLVTGNLAGLFSVWVNGKKKKKTDVSKAFFLFLYFICD